MGRGVYTTGCSCYPDTQYWKDYLENIWCGYGVSRQGDSPHRTLIIVLTDNHHVRLDKEIIMRGRARGPGPETGAHCQAFILGGNRSPCLTRTGDKETRSSQTSPPCFSELECDPVAPSTSLPYSVITSASESCPEDRVTHAMVTSAKGLQQADLVHSPTAIVLRDYEIPVTKYILDPDAHCFTVSEEDICDLETQNFTVCDVLQFPKSEDFDDRCILSGPQKDSEDVSGALSHGTPSDIEEGPLSPCALPDLGELGDLFEDGFPVCFLFDVD